MTLIEIVERLQREGNIVSYRHRSDGGIIITSINGKHYSGSEGNAVARRVVGATLSEARVSQLKDIKPPKGKSPKSRKQEAVDEDIKKYMRKVQRVWRKNVSKAKGKITLRKVRWNIRNLGIERTREKLRQSMNYAQGIAYSKNVMALCDYIDQLILKVNEDDARELQALEDEILAKIDSIKEEWISEIYDALYDINHGLPVRDIVARIRGIISRT